MTYIDDSKNSQGDSDPGYPVVFGKTLTPKVQGLALGVIGALAGLYVLINMILPAQEENGKLLETKAEKENQISELKSGEAQKEIQKIQEQVNQEKKLQTQTLGMFSDAKTLDTLLLDLNNLATSRQGILTSYTYDAQPLEQQIVNDGSLGTAVNNKLKRQKIKVEIEGTFNQTKTFLQDLERLQPLLLIKNFKIEHKEQEDLVKLENGQIIAAEQPILKTSFTIETISPLSPEEQSALAAQTAQTAQPGQPGAAPVPAIQTPPVKK